MLLIVAALDDARWIAGCKARATLGLDALVEVHDERGAGARIDAGARLIGVNNRNLRTLAVDRRAERLGRRSVPARSASPRAASARAPTSTRCTAAGYHAFLIGERFMTRRDPAPRWRAGGAPGRRRGPSTDGTRPAMKICGITRAEDASAAADSAHAAGFVFWPDSPRAIDAGSRARSSSRCRRSHAGRRVRRSAADDVRRAGRDVGLDVVQLHGDRDGGDAAARRPPVIKALAGATSRWRSAAWPEDGDAAARRHDRRARGGPAAHRLGRWRRALARAAPRSCSPAG